jgi:hypothetical protein
LEALSGDEVGVEGDREGSGGELDDEEEEEELMSSELKSVRGDGAVVVRCLRRPFSFFLFFRRVSIFSSLRCISSRGRTSPSLSSSSSSSSSFLSVLLLSLSVVLPACLRWWWWWRWLE